MKHRSTKDISLATIFAVLYAVAVIGLAPISFNIFQVRIGDALLPLSIIFGWPAIIGISIGTVVANFFGGIGFIDIIGGSIANFIATLMAWKIGNKAIKGSWIYAISVEILIVTFIVGSYLSYIFGMPFSIAVLGVLIGSVVAIGVVGYLLLTALSRKLVVQTLRLYGLQIYLKDEEE